jgi:uncharacterized protein YqfB (UPF0267 family)
LLHESISKDWTNLDIATISGDLKVTGVTQLANTSIGGKLTVGLLTFDDLEADIASLSEKLSIQNDSVIIDKNGGIMAQGKIEAKSVAAEKFSVLGAETLDHSGLNKASIGTINIEAGETRKVIQTTSLTETSKIFVSPVDEPVVVSAKKISKNEFEIKIKEAGSLPHTINWWIIN